MTCPVVIRVTTSTGPPGVGLPAGTADAGKFVRKAGATPYTYELVTPDQVGLPQGLATTSSPTFAGLTLSGLAANRLAFTGAGGVLLGYPLGSGLAIVDGALTASGGGGTGAAYVYSQLSPSSTWIINHNLGYRPTVELLDSGSQEIDGEIAHPTVNQTVVTLNPATAGLARLL